MSRASTSSRWCPTPEQLMILEEMYRGGMRTPNASQIQKITAHLSFYGKIEGKNVFYWFQNHKARDRQKLRRKLSKQLYQQQLLQYQFCVGLHHNPQNYSNFNFNVVNYDHPPNASASADVHQLSHDHQYIDHKPAAADHEYLLHQSTGVDGSCKAWKMDPPNMHELAADHSHMMIRSYGDDWTRIMIRDSILNPTAPMSPIPCCNINNRPLKTLQLFPMTTTAPSLKDQPQPNISL